MYHANADQTLAMLRVSGEVGPLIFMADVCVGAPLTINYRETIGVVERVHVNARDIVCVEALVDDRLCAGLLGSARTDIVEGLTLERDASTASVTICARNMAAFSGGLEILQRIQ